MGDTLGQKKRPQLGPRNKFEAHVLLGKIERNFATKNPPHFSLPQKSKFHHLELLGPLSCKKRVPSRNASKVFLGHGEIRVYRGTGVSRGVQRTTWGRDPSKFGSSKSLVLKRVFFFWGGNTLGRIPASLPHTLGFACTFYAPTSPPPNEGVWVGANRYLEQVDVLCLSLRC